MFLACLVSVYRFFRIRLPNGLTYEDNPRRQFNTSLYLASLLPISSLVVGIAIRELGNVVSLYGFAVFGAIVGFALSARKSTASQ